MTKLNVICFVTDQHRADHPFSEAWSSVNVTDLEHKTSGKGRQYVGSR